MHEKLIKLNLVGFSFVIFNFYIVDVTCLFDPQIVKEEKNKGKNCTDLKYEIFKIWKHEV